MLLSCVFLLVYNIVGVATHKYHRFCPCKVCNAFHNQHILSPNNLRTSYTCSFDTLMGTPLKTYHHPNNMLSNQPCNRYTFPLYCFCVARTTNSHIACNCTCSSVCILHIARRYRYSYYICLHQMSRGCSKSSFAHAHTAIESLL